MKCLTPVEMDTYLVNDRTSIEDEISLHLAECTSCRRLYGAMETEQLKWENGLYQKKLPEQFTANIMAALADVDVEPIEGSRARRISSRKWRGWRTALGAVLLVLFTAAAINGPTLAEVVRSLFTYQNVDIGLLRAQEFGLVENPAVKVKDQGFTVKINEAVADPTRVVMALQLFGPSGRHEDDWLSFGPPNQIEIIDEQGRQLGHMFDMGATGDFYYMIANFPEPIQADKITIRGSITRLGNEMLKLPVVEGDWSFAFTMDLRSAKAQTKVSALEGEHTSSSGMTVRLKRLTRMVQGVRLELETELSPEAMQRSSGEEWKHQELSFHFADAASNEIHSVKSRRIPSMDSLMAHSALPGERPGVMKHSYIFKYLPQDEPFVFVWEGYSIREQDGAYLRVEPAKLAEQPAVFRSTGDEIMIRRMTVEKDPDPGSSRMEAVLHVQGKLVNEYLSEQTYYVETGGQRFSVNGRGSISSEQGYFELGGGTADQHLFELRIPGITAVPDQLTLTRTVVYKYHSDVLWSKPIIEQ